MDNYDLFKFFADEHNLILTDTELNDIIHAVNEYQKPEIELKENEYIDLKDESEEVKKEFVQIVALGCAKELLKTFLSVNAENFIEIMIINDVDKKEYILSFQTKENFTKRFIPLQETQTI